MKNRMRYVLKTKKRCANCGLIIKEKWNHPKLWIHQIKHFRNFVGWEEEPFEYRIVNEYCCERCNHRDSLHDENDKGECFVPNCNCDGII